MKIKFLLLGTSLSLIPTLTFAQCVATQDCAALGYTETSCNGGKGVKCPFGNKWACLTSEEECLKLACDKLGFSYTCTGTGEKGVGNACNGKYQGCICDSSYQYTCTGTNQTGGSGTACGGKYTACTCKSPYTWKNGSCSCPSTYQYTCTGTNQTGGSGTACGGKYTACTCKSSFTWYNGACTQHIHLFSCPSGYQNSPCASNSITIGTADQACPCGLKNGKKCYKCEPRG